MEIGEESSWPSAGLEWLGKCPVCQCSSRTVLIDGLRDDVFRCAPGVWCLRRCDNCNSAYLDPRPSRDTISNAYGSYYTHQQTKKRSNYEVLGVLHRLRRSGANAYTNRRYGFCKQPERPWLGYVISLLPFLRHSLDLKHRWLRKPNGVAKILDVGCGNGAFLRAASEAGWDAYGVDPDPTAIQHAQQLGVDARVGDLDAFDGFESAFDAVTFSHSIEHMHDPVMALRTAARLLKPGGMLYLDTPNVDGPGRRRFQEKWRGIEAPRHLVLFSRSALEQVLSGLGFSEIKMRPRYSVVKTMAVRSAMLKLGRSPYEKPSHWIRFLAAWYAVNAFFSHSSEFITLTCRKVAPPANGTGVR